MKIKYLLFSLCVLLSACDGQDRARYQGYVEGENIYIASPYAGILVNKFVNRGQTVSEGSLLFNLDPNPEAYMVKQHQADLEQAKKTLVDLQQPRRTPEIKAIQDQINQVDAQLKLAALRVDRYKILASKGAVDKDSYDMTVARYQELEQQKEQYIANLELAKQGSRENQIQAQQSAVDKAKVVLEQSQWQLAQKTLKAPVDGVIFDTYYQEGEFVQAQHPVASLLNAKTLRVEFFVPMRVMNRLTLGQTISFSCNECAEVHHAKIHYISPEAEFIPPLVYSDANSDKLVFRIKALIEKSSTFKPGQPVMVTIQYDQ